MDLPTIALVIKDAKVGQGLKVLRGKLNDLVKRLQDGPMFEKMLVLYSKNF